MTDLRTKQTLKPAAYLAAKGFDRSLHSWVSHHIGARVAADPERSLTPVEVLQLETGLTLDEVLNRNRQAL